MTIDIGFIPGVLLVLLFYILFAKFWSKLADKIGEMIGLKKLIEFILSKFR